MVPLTIDEFYRAVGCPDLAANSRWRHRTKTGMIVFGSGLLASAVASMIAGFDVQAHSENSCDSTLPGTTCMEDTSARWTGVGVGIGLIGLASTAFGVGTGLSEQPTGHPRIVRAYELASQHNASLELNAAQPIDCDPGEPVNK